MKAIVAHHYGDPQVLKFEKCPDPVPGTGEVLVRSLPRVCIRSTTNDAPVNERLLPPYLSGPDRSRPCGDGGEGWAEVEGFSLGDQVFAMADDTYAELCVVKADVWAKVPKELDLIQAALPLVTTTGNQLLSATGIQAGQTVLVVGAAGNVGRSAVFTAKERRAAAIAGVLKRQMDEAKTVQADQVVTIDDDTAIANLPPLHAVADTVGGRSRR